MLLIPTHLDHVVVATPDLAGTVADIEVSTGIRAEQGGSHPGAGTRNHLISFGGDSYLEIIGVDTDQPEPDQPRRFLVDERDRAVVATWAAHPGRVEERIARAAEAGLDLGPVNDGGRRTPAGELISWRVTEPLRTGRDGTIPFLIDWGTTPSPATTIASRAESVEFALLHPEPARLVEQLSVLGITAEVAQAEQAGLRLTIAGPAGSWTLSC